MKITTLFSLGVACCISASTYAQSYKVSINKQNSSIIEILREIEKSSEFTFFFNDNRVNVNKIASVNAKNATLEEVLDQGKDIVFLTLGDPTIYSTFSYLQKRVEDDGYETALVSGITSFCAAVARTNQPLVEWNQTLHIVPAVHRLGDTPDAEGNYVFMKSGKKMKQVKEILRETGKQVSMVENCGMETEHVYRSVDEIPDDAGYYSLIIAKEHK